MTRNQFKTPSRVPNKRLPNDCLPVKKELVESPDPFRMQKAEPALELGIVRAGNQVGFWVADQR